jgi:hypothetical protein
MDSLFNFKNVHLDSISDDSVDTIVEKKYLKELFSQLEQKLGKEFYNYKFYILFSHNPTVIPDSFNFLEKNKILFWFSDESGLFPSHLENNYLIIFKSYIHTELSNVYSNPLGYVNEFAEEMNKSVETKDINVFFSGSLNVNRRKLFELLFFNKYWMLKFLNVLPDNILLKLFKKLKFKNLSCYRNVFLFSYGGFKSGIEYKKYFDYLLRSKFILCPKGNQSSETFRHIEAMKAGGIVISENMPEVSIYKNNPFIKFDNYSQLKSILKKIRRGEYDLATLFKEQKKFYESNFTVDAITIRIVEIIKKSSTCM